MDKEQSVMIRAICCIIVILVHIPQQHSNFIQDAIGSFGYIAVTIFFMLSAYGLKYSINHKKDYLKHFWKNRILVLLIPFWIANTLATLIAPQETIIANVFKIIGIKGISFVTILLGYYILFWMASGSNGLNIWYFVLLLCSRTKKNKSIKRNYFIWYPFYYFRCFLCEV